MEAKEEKSDNGFILSFIGGIFILINGLFIKVFLKGREGIGRFRNMLENSL